MNTLAEHFSKFLPEQVEVLTLEKFKEHESVKTLLSLETSIKEKYSTYLISVKMLIKVSDPVKDYRARSAVVADLIITDKLNFHKIRIRFRSKNHNGHIFPLDLDFDKFSDTNVDFCSSKTIKNSESMVPTLEELLKTDSFQSKMKMILRNSIIS